MDRKKLEEYILKRHNSDGGFGFAPPLYGWEFPSGLLDTYYCLSVISMMGRKIPNRGMVQGYVKDILDGKQTRSPAADFYALECARIAGMEIECTQAQAKKWEVCIARQAHAGGGLHSQWFSADYDAAGSPYQDVYASAFLLGKYCKGQKIGGLALAQNADGGFGIGKSDIASTAYCIAIGETLGIRANAQKAEGFIRLCRSGHGYATAPRSAPAFVECTYFACWALRMLGGRIPIDAVKFAEMLQNGDGGFRRALAGGISTPANSFFALGVIELAKGRSGVD